MRVLVALGGNAMTSPEGSATPEAQRTAIAGAMECVADLVAAGHEVVITHGNGPQVGNLLVKNELAANVVPPVPLDWCGAQTQGTLGFPRPTAAVVTRTLVNGDDPGFTHPTKPVGRFLPHEDARPLIEHGQIWEDRGAKGWRRVVASPEPLEVIDTHTVRTLLAAGYVVTAAGGGGIPVVRDADGQLRGVEAVIDKDLTAAILARSLDADVLVIATDVDHAIVGYGTADAQPLGVVTPAQMREYAAAGHFASGSMGPKVEAAVRFVESGGHRSVITSLAHIAEAVTGAYGTCIES